MPRFDLIIRNGTVVTGAGGQTADLGILDGRIAAIEREIDGDAGTTIDAGGMLVLPGGVDPHVHFNEPGRAGWEGWSSGSRALIAGGVTTCIEMPLNAHPPTLDRASFEAKVAAATASSHTDFGLWGGLTPDNVDRLPELAGAGVIGLKAFMSRSGTDDFRHAGDEVLYRGMLVAAACGLTVAVHAENDAITHDLASHARASFRTTMRDYIASRPAIAEIEAIGRALALAEASGCSLHIVHVSTGRGVALIAEARERGIDVTCETCPHYLALTDEDAERIGALAKCAPPLRDAETRASLREYLVAGDIDLVASDHSPAPPEMKRGRNHFDIWGGISGCQHALPVMLTLAPELGLTARDLVRLVATTAARRFNLPRKGEIAPGFDADIAIWRAQEPAPIPGELVQYRHPASAWDGFAMSHTLEMTILRGEITWRTGQRGWGPARGQMIRSVPV